MLKFIEAKKFVLGHKSSQWQSQNLNAVLLDFVACVRNHCDARSLSVFLPPSLHAFRAPGIVPGVRFRTRRTIPLLLVMNDSSGPWEHVGEQERRFTCIWYHL